MLDIPRDSEPGMAMLLGILKKEEDGGPASYIHRIAVPIITVGIAILAAPSFRDFLLRLLDKVFNTHLDFAQSPLTGFALLGIGLAIYFVERIVENFGGKPLLALRHQSFLPLPRTLSRGDLPRKISMNRVRPIDCDLYSVMNGPHKNVEAALSIQAEWTSKAIGAITTMPDAPVAYYGIVHIPFQFLAGCRFSTFKFVYLFELERGRDRWREIGARKGESSLQFIVDRTTSSAAAEDIAIRISISYTVPKGEVAKVLPAQFSDIHLRIKSPRIDAISSLSDLNELCSAFRKEIDNDNVRKNRIHIFYSGPVSLGFALGQQISPSIHGEVHVYNYDATLSPAYAWSINLSLSPRDVHVRYY
jgi:hypothetical protein